MKAAPAFSRYRPSMDIKKPAAAGFLGCCHYRMAALA
jgi:hypothetical protein